MEPIESRKLFVGGLPPQTNEETLEQHFSRYGTVEKSLIIFSKTSMAEQALQHKNHVILDREVEMKQAVPKGGLPEESSEYTSSNGDYDSEIKLKKIFVGGLPLNIKKEEFKSYFERFGTVIDAAVIYAKESGRPRGFGFITFDSEDEDAVDNVLQNRFHKLKDKMVEVKLAHPKDINNNNYNMTYYDCNKTISSLGSGFFNGCNGICCLYSAFQAHHYQCYGFGFGGWESPANLTLSSPPALLASYGLCCSGGYCYCGCHHMAESTATGNSNGDHCTGIEARLSPQNIDDLSCLKISEVGHQELEVHNHDSNSSHSNAAKHQS